MGGLVEVPRWADRRDYKGVSGAGCWILQMPPVQGSLFLGPDMPRYLLRYPRDLEHVAVSVSIIST